MNQSCFVSTLQAAAGGVMVVSGIFMIFNGCTAKTQTTAKATKMLFIIKVFFSKPLVKYQIKACCSALVIHLKLI